jgi:hypothetical protein
MIRLLSIGLYRKIVSYVLLRSGLGAPTDIGVVREATGILDTLVTYLSLFTDSCSPECVPSD